MSAKARRRLMHITLQPEAIENEMLRDQTVERIRSTTGFTPSNLNRLARYGVLTGLVDEDKKDDLRAVEGVISVEEDASKQTS